jgi:hypothetical protein
LVHQQKCGPALSSLHPLGELCSFSQLHHLEAQSLKFASAPTGFASKVVSATKVYDLQLK